MQRSAELKGEGRKEIRQADKAAILEEQLISKPHVNKRGCLMTNIIATPRCDGNKVLAVFLLVRNHRLLLLHLPHLTYLSAWSSQQRVKIIGPQSDPGKFSMWFRTGVANDDLVGRDLGAW